MHFNCYILSILYYFLINLVIQLVEKSGTELILFGSILKSLLQQESWLACQDSYRPALKANICDPGRKVPIPPVIPPGIPGGMLLYSPRWVGPL